MLNWDIDTAMRNMEVGDSFFVPTLNPMSLTTSILMRSRKLGIKVVCREAMQEEVLGVRTWRILPDVDTPPET